MQANRRNIKVYVKVGVVFREDGMMLPRSLTWEDGRKYPIDRVLDVRPACAERAGGQGDRYTVMIGGQHRYLFLNTVRTWAIQTSGDGLLKERNDSDDGQ